MLQDPIWFWNDVALEVERLDFVPFTNSMGEFGIAPQQAGPTRASRALAMVHIAMYDALALADAASKLTPYGATLSPPPGASAQAAVAGAAGRMLADLFPRQGGFVGQKTTEYSSILIGAGQSTTVVADGFYFGEKVALALEMARAADKPLVDAQDDHLYLFMPGQHQPDPYASGQGRLGVHWGDLKPFCSGAPKYNHNDFLDVWPDFNSSDPAIKQHYFDDFFEVKLKGAAVPTYLFDNASNSISPARTVDETVIGIFWAYDGAWNIGTPPRLYNQCVRAIVEALQAGGSTLTAPQLARLFALVHAGMADAGIIAWQAKYFYNLWRPVIGVRQQSKGYGQNHDSRTALPPLKNSDPFWKPLGAPFTNQPGKFYLTPNFPSYPSGHASFGTTCFELVRLFLKEAKLNEAVEFVVVSDELNGVNHDPDGSVRTYHKRKLTLADAITENILSRVFLGVHWRFDGIGKGPNHGLGGEAIGRILAPQLIANCFKLKP
jgi:membrane-associated phospholipid phosphatase